MSETVDATSQEFPGFFVIAAITRAKALGDKINSNPVEVTLLVNGVELPFVETMNDIYQRMERQIDEQAREVAEKMVTEAGLDGVADALREVEWKVKDALSNVGANANSASSDVIDHVD
jgi:hypothetical protein